MKKYFEKPRIEVVKLDMANLLQESRGGSSSIPIGNTCSNENFDGAKESFDED